MYSRILNCNAVFSPFLLVLSSNLIQNQQKVNNFGGKNQPDEGSSLSNDRTKYRATEAIVSLTLSIEGDSLIIKKGYNRKDNSKRIRTREELRQLLTSIAADTKVDECLLAAELLWAPEERQDILTKQDIAADYPELYPLLD